MCSKHPYAKLSEYEIVLYNETLLGDENVIGISILEATRIVELNEVILKTALRYMCIRHPLFRATLVEENDEKYFDIRENLDDILEKMDYEYIELNSDIELLKVIENFNVKLFAYENNCLLWRLKLIKYINNGAINGHLNDDDNKSGLKYALVLIVPMYMTDGINITTLLVELTNIINSLLENKECNEMSNKLELMDNIHSIMDKHNLFTKEKREFIEKAKKSQLNVNFNLPYKFKNIEDRGCKINLMKINRENTSKLVNVCKKRKAKSTGLLVEASYMAFSKLYQENGLHMQKDFSCYLPVNMRFRITPNIDFSHMRECIVLAHLNMIYPNINSETKDKWKCVEYVNSLIGEETNIENGALFKISHDSEIFTLFNYIFQQHRNDLQLATTIANCYNDCDFLLSNTGTYVYDRVERVEGPLKTIETYYGDSLVSNPSEFAPVMVHTSTWDGQLMLQLSSNRAILAAQYADRFMQHLYDSILSFLSD